MNCSCGIELKRFLQDSPTEGEIQEFVTVAVQLTDPTLPQTEEEWVMRGFWAAAHLNDAGRHLRAVVGNKSWEEYPDKELPFHDVFYPDGKLWRDGLLHRRPA